MRILPKIAASAGACWMIAALVLQDPLWAAPEPGAELLEKPLSVEETPNAMKCSFYPDLMIRETQADSPGRGPAYVVHRLSNGKWPKCSASHAAADVELHSANEAMLGRKGPLAFFVSTDAPGSLPFEVYKVSDGKMVYSDTSKPDFAVKSISVTSSAVSFSYTRGYDAPCSVPKDGLACWARILKEGRFVAAIRSQTPPIASCKAAYASSKTPITDRSLIFYDVIMSIPAIGNPVVISRGSVHCEPLP